MRHSPRYQWQAPVSVADHHARSDWQYGPHRHAVVVPRAVDGSGRGTLVRARAVVECNHGDNSEDSPL